MYGVDDPAFPSAFEASGNDTVCQDDSIARPHAYYTNKYLYYSDKSKTPEMIV